MIGISAIPSGMMKGEHGILLMGERTELIAQLPRADHDPYIDSDGVDTAISVWSHEEGNSADIYYSVWKANAWSTPARLGSSLSGYDSDPAIAMDTKEGAVAVWVNKNY